DDQRITLVALLGPERQAGEIEHLEHVQVVELERDGEADDVELGDRALALPGEERHPRAAELLLVERIGKEDPLADGIVALVEEAVDQLVAEVGHPQPVDVRKGEGETKAPAMGSVE